MTTTIRASVLLLALIVGGGSVSAASDALLKLEGVEGESVSTTEAKGSVEVNWKVEEGESARSGSATTSVRADDDSADDLDDDGDDDLDDDGDDSLKGGVSVAAGDIDGLTLEEKQAFLATVKTHAEVRSEHELEDFAKGVLLKDENVEDIEVGDESVQISYRMPARFLGVFEATLATETEVDSAGEVKVKLPWFAFLYSKLVASADLSAEVEAALASGNEKWVKSDAGSSARILALISNVLKTRHDTAKNSIGNVR